MPIYGGRSSYSESHYESDFTNEQVQELCECFLYDELSRVDDQTRTEFIQSEQCLALTEAGKFKRNTIVKLNKNDDLERRTTMAAIQLARDNNDPLYDKLTANRVKERELLGKIAQKYDQKAARLAKTAQAEFIKKIRNTIPFKSNLQK